MREEKESLPPCGLVHAGFRLAGPPLPGPLSRRAYKGGEGYANRRRTLQLPPLYVMWTKEAFTTHTAHTICSDHNPSLVVTISPECTDKVSAPCEC